MHCFTSFSLWKAHRFRQSLVHSRFTMLSLPTHAIFPPPSLTQPLTTHHFFDSLILNIHSSLHEDNTTLVLESIPSNTSPDHVELISGVMTSKTNALSVNSMSGRESFSLVSELDQSGHGTYRPSNQGESSPMDSLSHDSVTKVRISFRSVLDHL